MRKIVGAALHVTLHVVDEEGNVFVQTFKVLLDSDDHFGGLVSLLFAQSLFLLQLHLRIGLLKVVVFILS